MKYSNYTKIDIQKELSQICNELGHFPTCKELLDHKKSKLLNAIHKNKWSLFEFQKNLGYQPIKLPDGYWLNFENLSSAISKIIKNGNFPTIEEIKQKISGGATVGIKHFGGLATVANRMGYVTNTFLLCSDGHYVRSSLEYLFDEYLFSRGIIHDVDKKICDSLNHRYDFKVNDFYVEIWGFKRKDLNEKYVLKRKNKEEIYKKLSLKLISIESDLFDRSFDEIEEKLDEMFVSIGFDISIKNTVKIIQNAANKCGFWNEDRIIKELKEVIKISGKFPKQKELQATGKSALSNVISRGKGMSHYKKQLGFNESTNPPNYWNDETIISELKEISTKIGYVPTTTELRKMNRKDLLAAMSKRKGIKYYKNQIQIYD